MKITKQYIAGLFDGDGSITIQKGPPNRNNPDRWNPQYQLWCSIGQKRGKKVFKSIKDKYGGHVYFDKKRSFYTWRVIANVAKRFLKDIAPYLIIKKEEAILALEFAKKYHRDGKTIRGEDFHTPKEIVKEKEKYYQQLKVLHCY